LDLEAARKKHADNEKKLKDMTAELKKGRPSLEKLEKELAEKVRHCLHRSCVMNEQ
jgi:hypothetical protein